jgi:phosphoribosyl 1,2-cyclic phosphate phosphodiesterase
MKNNKGLRVTFLGTGTSMGVPVAGGFGDGIPTGDVRDERFRTSAWVESEQASVVIDVGPEFRLQTLRAGIKKIDLILFTHEHNDHVAGIDDLRPFNYVQGGSIPVVMTESCKKSVERRFEYIFGPNKTPGSTDIDISVSTDSFIFKDLKITPLPVYHGGLLVNGYRINDFAYITDANDIPESTFELIKGCKVLVLNALRWSPPHSTHFTVSEAVEIAKRTGIPEVYFVHMSSYIKHAETNSKLPKGMKLAYDQQVIWV